MHEMCQQWRGGGNKYTKLVVVTRLTSIFHDLTADLWAARLSREPAESAPRRVTLSHSGLKLCRPDKGPPMTGLPGGEWDGGGGRPRSVSKGPAKPPLPGRCRQISLPASGAEPIDDRVGELLPLTDSSRRTGPPGGISIHLTEPFDFAKRRPRPGPDLPRPEFLVGQDPVGVPYGKGRRVFTWRNR